MNSVNSYKKEALQLIAEGEITFCGCRVRLAANWRNEVAVTLPIGRRSPIAICVPPDEPVSVEALTRALTSIAQHEGVEKYV